MTTPHAHDTAAPRTMIVSHYIAEPHDASKRRGSAASHVMAESDDVQPPADLEATDMPIDTTVPLGTAISQDEAVPVDTRSRFPHDSTDRFPHDSTDRPAHNTTSRLPYETTSHISVATHQEIMDEDAAFAELHEAFHELSVRRPHQVVDGITAHLLGDHNPFSRLIDPETTTLWLFDNNAYRTERLRSWHADQPWETQLTAAYFRRDTGADLGRAVAAIARVVGLAFGDAHMTVVEKRLRPWVAEILPAHAVEVRVGVAVEERAKLAPATASEGNKKRVGALPGSTVVTLGPSNANGLSTDFVRLPMGEYYDGQVVDSRPVNCEDYIAGHTTICTNTGWAVCSDIDDTIKKTLTQSRVGTLRTTFVDKPEPVEGMPEFYEYMNVKLGSPPFWYLSGSPYNLYPFLHKFRDAHYPPGTMLLRQSSWMNLAGFLASLTEGVGPYKEKSLGNMFALFPGRRFVCLGDSTASDPEAYAAMYRKHPEWIRRIFIRKALHVVEPKALRPGYDDVERNRPERFEKAFKGVPRGVWYVFEEPKELYGKIDELVKEGLRG